MVFSAAAIRSDDTPDIARDKLLACTGDADVADRIASATGLSSAAFPLHEIYWGARRFMQVLAAQGPVLALFDDIHWAEPAFLDLLENLLETIDDAPVLLLATARRDLLEERPQWGEHERSSGWYCIRWGTPPRRRLLRTCSVRPDCPKRWCGASSTQPKATRCTSNRCWRC